MGSPGLDMNIIRNYLLQVGCKIEYPILVNHFKQHLYNPDPNVQGKIRTQFKDYVNRLAVVSLENNMKFIILRPEFRQPIAAPSSAQSSPLPQQKPPTLPPPPPPPPPLQQQQPQQQQVASNLQKPFIDQHHQHQSKAMIVGYGDQPPHSPATISSSNSSSPRLTSSINNLAPLVPPPVPQHQTTQREFVTQPPTFSTQSSNYTQPKSNNTQQPINHQHQYQRQQQQQLPTQAHMMPPPLPPLPHHSQNHHQKQQQLQPNANLLNRQQSLNEGQQQQQQRATKKTTHDTPDGANQDSNRNNMLPPPMLPPLVTKRTNSQQRPESLILTSSNQQQSSMPPPRPPPRRRQSTASLFNKPSSPSHPQVEKSREIHDLAKKSPGRVKEHALKLNSSTSSSDINALMPMKQLLMKENRPSRDPSMILTGGLQRNGSQLTTRSRSSHREDESDSSSLQPIDPLRRKWSIEACQCNYNGLLTLLREDPKLASYKDIVNGYTALHWAAKFDNLDIIKLIAGTHGVSANVRSSAGYTPLHVAKMFNRQEAADLLIKSYKANPDIRDHSGKKPNQYCGHNSISLTRTF